jgi:biotin carboxylase
MMKKILILAGSHFQIPVIRYAKEQGYYVITCDNIPENPGHRLSDKYVNVSTTDLDGVLQVAIDNEIDGILAYASHPAAPAAGYVSDKLGLPGNSFDAVNTLALKSKYRRFQKANKLNHPHFITAKGSEYRSDLLEGLQFPLMVKPVDSSGSKGVSRVDRLADMSEAVKAALLFSRSGEIIIEEVVRTAGHQIGGEAYVYKGELVMMCLGDQQINTESVYKYVPIGMTFPAEVDTTEREFLKAELSRLLALSGFRTGALNLEIMRTADDKFVFMEIGPRSGGNLLPELVKRVCGFDEAGISVEHALGNAMVPPKVFDTAKGFYAYFAIHARNNGIYGGLRKEPLLDSWIVAEHIFSKVGQEYGLFKHSGYVMGIWLMRFADKGSMDEFFRNPYRFYRLL